MWLEYKDPFRWPPTPSTWSWPFSCHCLSYYCQTAPKLFFHSSCPRKPFGDCPQPAGRLEAFKHPRSPGRGLGGVYGVYLSLTGASPLAVSWDQTEREQSPGIRSLGPHPATRSLCLILHPAKQKGRTRWVIFTFSLWSCRAQRRWCRATAGDKGEGLWDTFLTHPYVSHKGTHNHTHSHVHSRSFSLLRSSHLFHAPACCKGQMTP